MEIVCGVWFAWVCVAGGTGPRFNRPVEYDPELIVAVTKTPDRAADTARQKADFGIEDDGLDIDDDFGDGGGRAAGNGGGGGTMMGGHGGGGNGKQQEMEHPDVVKVSRIELDNINRAMQDAALARQTAELNARKAEERAARTEQMARSTQAMVLKKHTAALTAMQEQLDEQSHRVTEDDELLEQLYAKIGVLEASLPPATAQQLAQRGEQFKTAEKANGAAITRARELDRECSDWKRRSAEYEAQLRATRDELAATKQAAAAGGALNASGLMTPPATPMKDAKAGGDAPPSTPMTPAAAAASASSSGSSSSAAAAAELAAKQRDIDALQQTIAALKQQLLTLQQQAAAQSKAASEAAALNATQLAQAQAQAQAAIASAGQSGNAAAASSAAQLLAAQQQLAQVQQQMAAAQQSAAQNKAQADQAAATGAELQSKLRTLQSQLDALQKDKAAAEAAAQSASGQVRDLQGERIRAEEKITALATQLKQVQSGASTSGAEFAEQLAALTGQKRALELESKANADAAADLRTKLAAAEANAAALNGKLGAADSTSSGLTAKLQAAEQQVRDWQLKAGNAEAAAAGVAAQLKSLQSSSSDNATASAATAAKLAELQSQYGSSTAQVAALQGQLAAATAQQNTLSAQITSLNAQIATLTSAAAEKDGAAQALTKEKVRLEELLRELNDVLAKREEETKTLRTKAKDKLALATTTVNKLKSEYTNLRTLYTNEKKQLTDRVTELEAAAAATATAHTAALEASKQDAETIRAELTKQVQESERLRGESESAAKKKVEQLRTDGLKLKEMAQRMQLKLKAAAASAESRRKALSAIAPQLKALKDALPALKSSVTSQLSSGALGNVIGDSVKSYMDKALASVMVKYREEIKQRKKLFNELQELKGNIRVFARVRGLNGDELKSKTPVAFKFPEDDTLVVRDEKRNTNHTFEFDKVFVPTITQEQVFAEVSPLIQSVLDGYNVCIFAYGQTGSGKTYTMEGPVSDRGVNYRALDLLFAMAPKQTETSYEFSMSLLEIYNEKVLDLLSDTAGAADRNAPGAGLKVKKAADGGGNEAVGLTVESVTSSEAVIKLMKKGSSHRAVTGTNSNAASSRSHLILSVYVTATNTVSKKRLASKLHLIDLAGSERVADSGVTGAALVEATAINSSLSALGNVINARASKASFVPYRNSALTYLLQDSLDKNSKTLMICQLAPTTDDSAESLCSLRFASRARQVELGQATKNVAPSAAAAGAGGGGGSTPKTPVKTVRTVA